MATASYGDIDPTHGYDLENTARVLGRTKRWVQDNLIRNDAVPHFRRGEYIGIPGWVLLQWMESDLRKHSEWQETDDSEAATAPPSKSKSKP